MGYVRHFEKFFLDGGGELARVAKEVFKALARVNVDAVWLVLQGASEVMEWLGRVKKGGEVLLREM